MARRPVPHAMLIVLRIKKPFYLIKIKGFDLTKICMSPILPPPALSVSGLMGRDICSPLSAGFFQLPRLFLSCDLIIIQKTLNVNKNLAPRPTFILKAVGENPLLLFFQEQQQRISEDVTGYDLSDGHKPHSGRHGQICGKL